MASKWIQKAIKKPGALRKSLGVKKGEKIPAKKLAAAAKKKGMSDKMLKEIIAVVGMANETNKLVESYQVEVDEFLK